MPVLPPAESPTRIPCFVLQGEALVAATQAQGFWDLGFSGCQGKSCVPCVPL